MNSFQRHTSRLRENIRRKRLELLANKPWIFQNVNAPSFRAAVVKELKTKSLFNTIDPPPSYLPLRGTRFDSIEAVKESSQRELKAMLHSD